MQGLERKICNHELIVLNPNYKGEGTPPNYRDWLDLIYESSYHPNHPSINISNLGIKRASKLVNIIIINSSEWEASKLAASFLTVLDIREEKGKEAGIEIGIV